MTTETLLARTKDNSVIAFTINYADTDERARLKKECEDLCGNINIGDFRSNMIRSSSIKFDKENTNFLLHEIAGYHYRKDREHFCNNMNVDAPAKADTLSFSYKMKDDEFPEMVKNLGFHIEPKDKTYEVLYNPKTNEFYEQNYEKTSAYIDPDDRRITIIRNHYHFATEDYKRLQELVDKFHESRKRNPRLSSSVYVVTLPDLRDRALFNFYTSRKRKASNRFALMSHEIRHIDNAVLKDGRSLKSDTKRLSVENMYRLPAEDERSAFVMELVHDINEYLIRGNYNDFSMFYINNKNFVADLKKLKTPEERMAYAYDWQSMFIKKQKEFETDLRKQYDEIPEGTDPAELKYDSDGDCLSLQFLQQTKRNVFEAPMEAPEDVDGSEFKKIRSLFYNYKIFNPYTRSFEYVNMAKYITPDLEVKINDKIRKEVIEPQKARLDARLNDYAEKKANGTVNPALIEPAKALMRGAANSSVFIEQVGNLRVSSLYEEEEKTQKPQSSNPEPQTSPDSEKKTTPTPPSGKPSVPGDRIEWINPLENYWNKVEGYREVAKNNNEYTFKVKDTTVRYTTQKDVEIGKNATYELYVKILKEPTSQNAPVEFLNTLSKEQALLLYIACINNGRRPIGAVPTDLTGIEKLKGIPAAEINKFRYRMQKDSAAKENSSQKPSPVLHQRLLPLSRPQNTR